MTYCLYIYMLILHRCSHAKLGQLCQPNNGGEVAVLTLQQMQFCRRREQDGGTYPGLPSDCVQTWLLGYLAVSAGAPDCLCKQRMPVPLTLC